MQARTRKSKQPQIKKHCHRHNGPGVGIVPAGHIIESAMRLKMGQAHVKSLGRSCEPSDLVEAILVDLLLGTSEFPAAKVFPVMKARMSPDTDAVLRGRGQRGKSSRGIACMEAASNGCRRDQRHQLLIRGA